MGQPTEIIIIGGGGQPPGGGRSAIPTVVGDGVNEWTVIDTGSPPVGGVSVRVPSVGSMADRLRAAADVLDGTE